VVAITVAQRGAGGSARALAHGYPLQSQALGPCWPLLADRHGIAAELHALGRIVLDEHGRSAPRRLLCTEAAGSLCSGSRQAHDGAPDRGTE
jgi:hypothetical protein